jgi:16S rRNA (cytosine1407-C5)-methyltransferase
MAYEIPQELDQFLENLLGSERQKFYQQIGRKMPHHIRFNPLKGSVQDQQAFFEEQGFRFTPLEEREDIFRITYQPYPIGRSLSHFLGHIYVQDIASMIPAMVLDPQPGNFVLDMSAAPGSKTTLLAAMMNNQGVLLANDIVRKRIKALGKNIERMSLCNTLLYRWYGEQYGNTYFESFDKVLLDPACSGLGTLHKNPEILTWWTTGHCERLADSQKNLLISAIKSLRPGGELVYSTCTLTTMENEEIINFALNEFPVEVEEIQLEGIKTWPGLTNSEDRTFHSDLAKTIRLYPFDRMTEGFYVAHLRKTDSTKKPRQERQKGKTHIPFISSKTSPVKKYLDYICERFQIPESVFKDYVYLIQKDIVFIDRDILDFPIYGSPLQVGLPLARAMDYGGKLNTGGCHLFGHLAQRMVLELPDMETLNKFVNREALDIRMENNGQHIVKYKNIVIGYAIAENGQLKSQFPKGDWPFQLLGEWSRESNDTEEDEIEM